MCDLVYVMCVCAHSCQSVPAWQTRSLLSSQEGVTSRGVIAHHHQTKKKKRNVHPRWIEPPTFYKKIKRVVMMMRGRSEVVKGFSLSGQ